MTAESSSIQPDPLAGGDGEQELSVRPSRLGAAGDSPLASNIVSVASVALVEGSPRLAARAAYTVLHDTYSERSSSRRRWVRRRRAA